MLTYTLIKHVKEKKERERRHTDVAPPPGDVLKQGCLKKTGETNMSWKVRWIILKDKWLGYYDSQTVPKENIKPNGGILITESDSVLPLESESDQHVFTYRSASADRIFLLKATSNYERDDWIVALTNAINGLQIEKHRKEKEQKKN